MVHQDLMQQSRMHSVLPRCFIKIPLPPLGGGLLGQNTSSYRNLRTKDSISLLSCIYIYMHILWQSKKTATTKTESHMEAHL